jgi:hypothetical protein
MRKFLFVIAAAIAAGFTSCSSDDCDHNIESKNNQSNSIVGLWYEEAENEETRYNANGTFYDRYANYQRCAETEGRWEFDSSNKKLTSTYNFLGQVQYIDWTVKNLTDFSLTISSAKNGDHDLEKIVEEYTLDVGQTATIQFGNNYPGYQVLSYSSNNSHIVSVSSDGVLKAEGEKGTTYIKITTTTVNVWVRVVVGDDCADLWYDYVSLLGQDYTGVRKTLSVLGDPYNGSDGYTFVFFYTLHDVLDHTNVYINKEKGVATEVDLYIKESVSESEILTYMNSHYYKLGESGTNVYYTTQETVDDSRSIILYDKEEKIVVFWDKEDVLNPTNKVDNSFGTYYEALGKNREEIVSVYGDPYLTSGSYLYYIPDNSYVSYLVFSIDDETNLCTSVSLLLNDDVEASFVVNVFSNYTVYEKGTLADGSQYAWIDGTNMNNSSMGIVFNVENKLVTYLSFSSTGSAALRKVPLLMKNIVRP